MPISHTNDTAHPVIFVVEQDPCLLYRSRWPIEAVGPYYLQRGVKRVNLLFLKFKPYIWRDE